MANNKLRGPKPISGDPEVKMPKFNFSDYDGSGRTVYHNNDEYIDFVTYNGALYVCLVPTIAPTTSAPSEGFLKLVDKGSVGPKGTPGRDGASAVAPRIGANFINDQLAVTVNDRTVAVSPSLTGPSWKPVREGDHLTWELTDDKDSPEDINLMDLRPVDKCPLLLRVDSDNTKRSDEVSGPARFIQWKYEGDKYWTNLISISELMNLALCGICFWYDKHDQEWHYGHREVIRADYSSNKNGRKIISRVKLGDVLFDAGVLPINDYGVEIELINQRLAEIEDNMVKSITINGGGKLTPDSDGNIDLPIDLSDYAKKNWVDANFQPVGDYVEGIRVNGGRVNRPENGIVNLEIEEGGSGDDSDCVKSVEIDGDKKYPVDGNVSFNLGDKYNLFDLIYRNGHLYKVVNGNETDLGEFGPSGEPTEGDGVGVDNIEFRINSSTGKLEFRMSIDGDWKSWNPIDLPAGSGGEGDGVGIDDIKFELQNGQLKYQVSIDGVWEDVWKNIPLPSGTTGGEHVDLQITSTGMLQIRYDGGEWQDVGMVNSDSDLSNAFINVSIRNNKLIFVRKNGTTEEVDIPSGGSEGSVVSVRQILLSGTHIATITVDGTDYKIYAPNGSGGGGDDDDPGSGSTVIADLTNEIDPVPVNDENIVHTAMTFNTTGRMWKDGVELAIDSITTSYSKSGVTVTTNGANCTIVVDENVVLDSTQEIMFALTAGSITRYVAYKLVPIRAEAGSTYGVVVDPTAIVVDKNGNYSVNEITVSTYWLRNGELKPLAGWDSVDDISSWSVWYYVDDAQSGVRYTQNSNLDLDFIRTINRQIRFELIFKAAGNSTTIDIETVPIIRDGSDGQNGQPGPAGPRGDEYQKVYGLAGNSIPASKSIDATQEDANGKTSADDGYLPKFVFDGVSIDATATPSGVSESNRYEYESIRRKHDGVWGPFSAPALHSNFVEAGLTDEQLENIKNDVEAAIGQDLADAQQRLTDAEGRLDAIDGEGSTFLQDNASSLVQILTNYEDEDQKSFADLVVDGKKATIEQWAASKVANDLGEESLVSVKSQLDGINGVIGNYADYTEDGELKTVKQLLDAKAATAEIAATYATKESVTSARTEWNAEAERLQSSVAKATYVWVKYDEDDNVVDVKPFDGEDSVPGYVKELSAEAMTAIRQSASEVDIIAGVADNWAQIIAKADEDESSIILDADHINLSGTTDATKAVIGEATITDATITNGTITSATINDCTINSSIVSDNYDNINKTGFMIDPENGDFAFYADNAKFDSDNGLQFDGDQTISWDDIDGKPESLEDLDSDNTLSTFITRDSLTTNKITANEIDASDLEIAAANITGKLTASQIDADELEVNAANITGKLTADQIDASELEVDAANITGEIHATVASFDYLTVDGDPISADNSLDIAFGDSSTSTTAKYTLYFLY